MAEFFRTSTTWVVDFRYEGRPRRWFKILRQDTDVRQQMTKSLSQLYGARAQLVEVREATAEEEAQYLRGEEPKNTVCPTGRECRTEPAAGSAVNAGIDDAPPPGEFPPWQR